jgi:hypothetical protein
METNAAVQRKRDVPARSKRKRPPGVPTRRAFSFDLMKVFVLAFFAAPLWAGATLSG